MPVQNSNISMNNIINQSDSYYSDSIISEPKLYATDLQFSITDKELADLFADVPPIKLQINRPNVPLNTPHTNTAVITFSSIEHAEKAYAIYNNTKLEAYNTYLKLHINDPATGIHNDLRTDALILIVKQVNPANTNLTLFDLFRQFGPLFSVRMQYQDNKFKGFAYIQYFRKDDADKAIHSLNNSKQIDNKPLTVQYYVPRNKTQNHSNSNNNAKSMGMPIQYQMNYNNNNQQQQHLQQQQHQQLPQQPQQQPQGPTSPGSEGPLVDPCNLFIKNLDSSISSSDLFKQFRKYGKIISARVMRDQESSNSKGFGFVSYSTAEEADKAKREMNGKLLGSKSITVRLHEPKKLREAKLANQYSPSGVNSGNNNNNNNLGGGGGGGGGGRISSSSNNNNNNNNNENRVPSRRNSELFHINMFNEFTHDDLHSLAPKARREVLMSELKKRFENIPSIPNEQVNPIIEYILNSKTHEILYVLKDPASLQMKIAEARQSLFEKKQHGNIGGPSFNITNNNNNANHLNSNHYVNNNSLNNPSTTTDMSNAASQVSQREKFHKAIMKISPVNVDEILDLLLTLSVKEKTKCYFNSEYLNKKINEAVQALEVVTNDDSSSTSPSTPSKSIDSSIDNPISNPLFLKSTDSISTTGSITKFPHMRITSTTTTSATSSSSSSTRNVEWEEVEQFMESIKYKALHERKQKLGDRLFPKVKALGLKSAMASKVTINLLDTDNLYELAHSMYDAAKFKAKVEAAEKAVNAK